MACAAVDRGAERRVAVRDLMPRAFPLSLKLLCGKVWTVGYVPLGADRGVVQHVAERLYAVPTGSLAVGWQVVAAAQRALFARGVIEGPGVVPAVLRIRGGKGGFGSTLRAKGKSTAYKTTNYDACRNLQGQRLRHERQIEALRKWGEGQDDADDTTFVLDGVLTPSELKKKAKERDEMRGKSKLTAQQQNIVNQREKAEAKERRAREGFAELAKQSGAVVDSTKDAMASAMSARKRRRVDAAETMHCPDGHPLTQCRAGAKGTGTSGFDFNVCDECDEVIDDRIYRCRECDYDICHECKNFHGTHAAPQPPKKPAKGKPTKAVMGDLSSDDSD